jgi:histidinol-phosphate aminotransferase
MVASIHPGELAVPAVRNLAPYVPGKPISELERELGLHDIIKLASNENPYGASPVALAAIRAALEEVWLYPDGSCHALKRQLAAHLAVDASSLSIGNGSNDLLMLLCEAFLTPAHSAICSQYGFAIYPLVIRATGARLIEVPALPATDPMPYGHDLAAMAAAIRPDTRLVFIANPNNPTGTWAPQADLERLLAAAPASALIVLDEAYIEYAQERGVQQEQAGLDWLHKHPNLVLLRTFSKAYGLAGARVGYGISHPEVAAVLDRLRPAFNVNSLAQAGALAALSEQEYMRSCVRRTMAEQLRFEAHCRRLGVWTAPSAANFLMVRVGPAAQQVYDRLLRAGIIVRPLAGYGLPQFLRISVGRPADTERLFAALPGALG